MDQPEVILGDYPLKGDFQVNDSVIDITAEHNGWPDQKGTIIEIDGGNVKVLYASGTERWKMHVNLRKDQNTKK